MARNVDRAQRRELISQAAERHRRRQGGWAPGHRASAACPTCGTPIEGEAGGRRVAAPVESQAPGTLRA